MNNRSDFRKRDDGVVINTNRQDFKRARNRNFTRREQEKIIGEDGEVAKLRQEIEELKALLKQSIITENNGEHNS